MVPRSHTKIIYVLAFHSFITDMALPIAYYFLREITARSFSLEACPFNLVWRSAFKISIVDSNYIFVCRKLPQEDVKSLIPGARGFFRLLIVTSRVSSNLFCAIPFWKCCNTTHWEETLIFARHKYLCPFEFLKFRSPNYVDECGIINRNIHLIYSNLVPRPVWTLWRRKKSHTPNVNRNTSRQLPSNCNKDYCVIRIACIINASIP